MSDISEKRTLRDALRVIFRRWPLFLVSSLAFATIAMIAAHSLPLKYTGVAKLRRWTDPETEEAARERLVNLHWALPTDLAGVNAIREAIDDVDFSEDEEDAAQRKKEEEGATDTKKDKALEPKNVTNTAKKKWRFRDAEPDAEREKNGELTEKALRELTVKFTRNTRVTLEAQSQWEDIALVSFTHEDPELAKRFANQLVSGYIERKREELINGLVKRKTVYDKKAEKIEERIEGEYDEDGKKTREGLKHEKARLERESYTKDAKDPNNTTNSKNSSGILQRRVYILSSPEVLQRRVSEMGSSIRTLNLQLKRAREEKNRLEQLLGKTMPAGKVPLIQFCTQYIWPYVLKPPVRGMPILPGDAQTAGKVELIRFLNQYVAKLPGKADPELEKLKKDCEAAEEEVIRLTDALGYLEGRLDVARTVHRLTDLHPEVRVLLDKIEQTRRQLQSAEGKRDKLKAGLPKDQVIAIEKDDGDRKLLESRLHTADYEVEVTRKEIERLTKQQAALETLIEDSFPIRQRYLELTKKLEEAEDELKKWREESEKVQLAMQELEKGVTTPDPRDKQEGLQVYLQAYDLDRPSSPTPVGVATMTILGGTAFGVGLVVLLNFLDRSVSTTEEATKYFGVPVHGVIGEILTKKRRRRLKLKHWVMWPVIYSFLFIVLGIAGYSIGLKLLKPKEYDEKVKGTRIDRHVGYVLGEAWNFLGDAKDSVMP